MDNYYYIDSPHKPSINGLKVFLKEVSTNGGSYRSLVVISKGFCISNEYSKGQRLLLSNYSIKPWNNIMESLYG